jgi:hypothetical protein
MSGRSPGYQAGAVYAVFKLSALGQIPVGPVAADRLLHSPLFLRHLKPLQIGQNAGLQPDATLWGSDARRRTITPAAPATPAAAPPASRPPEQRKSAAPHSQPNPGAGGRGRSGPCTGFWYGAAPATKGTAPRRIRTGPRNAGAPWRGAAGPLGPPPPRRQSPLSA